MTLDLTHQSRSNKLHSYYFRTLGAVFEWATLNLGNVHFGGKTQITKHIIKHTLPKANMQNSCPHPKLRSVLQKRNNFAACKERLSLTHWDSVLSLKNICNSAKLHRSLYPQKTKDSTPNAHKTAAYRSISFENLDHHSICCCRSLPQSIITQMG